MMVQGVGRSSTVRNDESRGKIRQFLLQNRTPSVRIMSEMSGTSREALKLRPHWYKNAREAGRGRHA